MKIYCQKKKKILCKLISLNALLGARFKKIEKSGARPSKDKSSILHRPTTAILLLLPHSVTGEPT